MSSWIGIAVACAVIGAFAAGIASAFVKPRGDPRYCTKHVIVKSKIPGGPERLAWVYLRTHRTPGNACDGPEHRHTSGWW